MPGRLRRRAVLEAQRFTLRAQDARDDGQWLARHGQQLLDGPLSIAHTHVGEASADNEGRESGDADGPRAHGTGLAGSIERRPREGTSRCAEGWIDDA